MRYILEAFALHVVIVLP